MVNVQLMLVGFNKNQLILIDMNRFPIDFMRFSNEIDKYLIASNRFPIGLNKC